jgi:hypothetical protein
MNFLFVLKRSIIAIDVMKRNPIHPMDFKVKWDPLPEHLEEPNDKVLRENLLLSDTPLSEDEQFCFIFFLLNN